MSKSITFDKSQYDPSPVIHVLTADSPLRPNTTYGADVKNGSIVLTLPTTHHTGDIITIIDIYNTIKIGSTLTVTSTDPIDASSSDAVITSLDSAFVLKSIGTGWIISQGKHQPGSLAIDKANDPGKLATLGDLRSVDMATLKTVDKATLKDLHAGIGDKLVTLKLLLSQITVGSPVGQLEHEIKALAAAGDYAVDAISKTLEAAKSEVAAVQLLKTTALNEITVEKVKALSEIRSEGVKMITALATAGDAQIRQLHTHP